MSKRNKRSIRFVNRFLKNLYKKHSALINSAIIRICAFIEFILIWFIIIALARLGVQFLMARSIHLLPTPMETLSALAETLHPQMSGPVIRPSILEHAGWSLYRVLIGFSIACLIGIPSGLIMGQSKSAADLMGVPIEFIRPIPPLAWVGIGLLIFRFQAPIFIVFIGAIFPIILSTTHGVRSIDRQLFEAARTLGAKGFDLQRKIIFPGSIPSIVTGMRIGLGIGWMCIVAAEMIGLKEGVGLGYFVWEMYDLGVGYYDRMVAGIVMIGIIGWLMNFIIETTEKYTVKWRLS